MEIIRRGLKFRMNQIATGNKPNTIVLHHAEHPSCTVEDVHSWHLSNGWAGIGYHYLVDKSGKVFKGREDNWIGSHAYKHNTNTLGICAVGCYTKETMPEAQLKAIKQLVSELKVKYGITKVVPHNHWGGTTCPGSKYPLVEIIGVKPNSPANPNRPSKPSRPKPFVPNLDELWKYCINGQEVKALQQQIIGQGFGNIKKDGYFGKNTVRSCPTCKIGARGGISRLIKIRLKSKGYGKYMDDNDIFGKGTKEAVQDFQRSRGLVADGIVGFNTWIQLYLK